MGNCEIGSRQTAWFRSEHIYADMVRIRRWFHRHPELAFEEVETAEFIINELKRLGLPYEYGGKGSGVIARLKRDSSRPTVALRAEMDALPGSESTGAPYASDHPGRVHACGHGAHMAMVLGAARLLTETPPDGNVVLIFQPAEERGAGSRTTIEAGALDGVSAIFAGHVTHQWEPGRIMVKKGVVTSQSDRFSIHITGRGGHGARPHEAIDAVVIAGFLITAIQTLVSREINPLHPSVVTIGTVQAGSAANVIAEEATLEGSIRTTLEETRTHLHRGLRRMAEAASMLHGAEIQIDIHEGYPPVVNSSRESEIARNAVHNVLGEHGLVGSEYPSMGSEDFSYFLREVPGCFVRFGARPPDWEPIPLHSPAFDIDERVLKIGASFFDEIVRLSLHEYRQPA